MLRFFRRQRPAPTPQLASSETLLAAYWGLDGPGWQRLTEKDRAYKRANVTYAPNFKP